MKIGIISDIHGNSFALDAVLKDAIRFNIEKYFILGDNIGYYYHPDKVFEALERIDCIQINGNHEKILLDIKNGIVSVAMMTEKYGSGHRIALNKLNAENLELISTNTYKQSITQDGIRILIAHASPWDADTYIYPDSPVDILKKFDLPEYDFIFIGHTHYPAIFKAGHTMVVNPGSVGQSRLCGGVANWALFNSLTKSIQPISTLYDTSSLLKEVFKNDPTLNYLQAILKRGNS